MCALIISVILEWTSNKYTAQMCATDSNAIYMVPSVTEFLTLYNLQLSIEMSDSICDGPEQTESLCNLSLTVMH